MKNNTQLIIKLVHSAPSKHLTDILTEDEINQALKDAGIISPEVDQKEIIEDDETIDLSPPPSNRQGLPTKVFPKKNSSDLPHNSKVINLPSKNPF